MSINLPYASLRCVLEYLEANKRLHITSRSPQLRQVHKSIPLHLKHLSFENDKFSINKLKYQLENCKKLLPRGARSFRNWCYDFYGMTFQKANGKEICKPILKDLDPQTASEILWNFIANFKEIHVENMVINLENQLLPLNLTVFPRNLYLANLDIEDRIPIFTPLEDLEIMLVDPEILTQDFVKAARKLTIIGQNVRIPLQFLVDLQNKHLIIQKYRLRRNQKLDLIENWLQTEKELGSTLTMECFRKRCIIEILTAARRRFGGKCQFLEEKFEGLYATPICIYIPINLSSELYICGYPVQGEPLKWMLRAEVVAPGASNQLGTVDFLAVFLLCLPTVLTLFIYFFFKLIPRR